jgi:uncharacterized protein (TIGR03435 family)
MGQMPESDDHQLLGEFVRCRSEAAFTELVRRYAGLMYSTAFRFCNNPHHAEEITQAVFIILARKAGTLSPRVVLSGWLYQAARLIAANFVKGEIRRRHREQEAVMQSTLHETDSTGWEKIAPLLDDAMGALGETDRNAVLLRYFEDRTSSEIGVALRMNEETARKRVNRALEKLRQFFVKRGVTVSSAALSGAISANSVQPISAFMVKSISAVALAKGAAASTSTLTLIKGALKIMAWTKAKTAIVAGVGVLLAAGTTSIVIEKVESPSVDESFWEMKLENLHKAPPVIIIRPTHYSDHTAMTDREKWIAHNMDFKGLLEVAYAFTNSDGYQVFSRERMILPTDAPKSRYDLMFTLSNHSMEKLQQAISRTTGFAARKEIRQTDVFLLNIKDPVLLALHVSKKGTKMNHKQENNMWAAFNQPISDTARFLEGVFHKPVLAPPDLSGRYDFTFQWQDSQLRPEALKQGLDEAALELAPTNMPVEMLVVEKKK